MFLVQCQNWLRCERKDVDRFSALSFSHTKKNHTQWCVWEKGLRPLWLFVCPKSSNNDVQKDTICNHKALRHADTRDQLEKRNCSRTAYLAHHSLSPVLVYNLSHLEQGCLKAARWNAMAWNALEGGASAGTLSYRTSNLFTPWNL